MQILTSSTPQPKLSYHYKQIRHLGLIWSCITTGILWLHAQLYQHFLSDDALISMRYSERLLEGKGLTWTDGIPVEGYSNLLWVLLTAALGALGIDLVDAVRILGFVCNASVVFALWYLFMTRLKPGHESLLPLILAQLFWVLLGSTAVWSMGGLEQPLLTGALVWAAVLLIPALEKPEIDYRAILLASIGLAAVVLTRPDGPLFTVCFCLVWWCFRPKNQRNFLAGILLGLTPFIAFAGQMGFRLAYYGDWVPNTAHVKVVFTNSRLVSGILYTSQALASASPFFELALLGTAYSFYSKKDKVSLVCVLVPMAAWIVYITSVGGDIFPAFRHGLVLYGLMSIAVLIVAQHLETGASRFIPKWLQFALVGLCFAPFLVIQIGADENREAFYEYWEWDGQAVGETLQQAFGEQQPLYAVTAAGSLPYWSKLPSLDMLGLNDYHIARNPPPNFGHGELGHDLGDGAYVLAQKPGIVSFCGPFGSHDPCRLSGQEMVKTKEFTEFYVPVFIAIKPKNGRPPFTNIQWIRWQDSPIGVEKTDQLTSIPAYLGANTKEVPALLMNKTLVVSLNPGQSITLPGEYPLAGSEIKVKTSKETQSLLLSGLMRTKKETQLTLVNTTNKNIILERIFVLQPNAVALNTPNTLLN